MNVLDDPRVKRREFNPDATEGDELRYYWMIESGAYEVVGGQRAEGYLVAYAPDAEAWLVYNCYTVWVGSNDHPLAAYGRRPELTAHFTTKEAAIEAVLSA